MVIVVNKFHQSLQLNAFFFFFALSQVCAHVAGCIIKLNCGRGKTEVEEMRESDTADLSVQQTGTLSDISDSLSFTSHHGLLTRGLKSGPISNVTARSERVMKNL